MQSLHTLKLSNNQFVFGCIVLDNPHSGAISHMNISLQLDKPRLNNTPIIDYLRFSEFPFALTRSLSNLRLLDISYNKIQVGVNFSLCVSPFDVTSTCLACSDCRLERQAHVAVAATTVSHDTQLEQQQIAEGIS